MTQAPIIEKKNYDLEERTAKFGEDVIRFCRKIARSPVADPLINQLVKAGTSVGQIIVKQMTQKVKKISGTK